MLKTLQLHPHDNIVICLDNANAHETFVLQGTTIEIKHKIMFGHKIAIAKICKGEKVFKYGMPIGSAKMDILPGEHVHSHNLKSNYQVALSESL